jgi:hypothetical protein
MKTKIFAAICAVLFIAIAVQRCIAQSVLTNGNFETGDFYGWTFFTNANGNIQQPSVVNFDITDTGTLTPAARFQVGSAIASPALEGGGGIYQTFNLPTEANLTFTMNAAIYSEYYNGSGGIISALLDQQTVAEWDVGTLGFGGVTVYTNLTEIITGVSPGEHQIEIDIERFGGAGNQTPYQYISDISLTPSAAPEPNLLPITLILAFALIRLRRRKPSQTSPNTALEPL